VSEAIKQYALNQEVSMNFKKFALLILTVIMISGFYAKPVSASANDDEKSITPIENTAEDTKNTEGTEEYVSGLEENSVPEEQPDDAEQSAADSDAQVIVNEKTDSNFVAKTKSVAKKSTKESYSASDLRLMASIINCEAGGESLQGKIAVGIVIMNRVESKDFPNTIKKVIYQKNQFSPVKNGMLNKKLKQYDAGKTGSAQWKSCISAAKKVLNGQRTIIYKGKVKSLKGYHFFSVVLPGAKIKLGGHRFK